MLEMFIEVRDQLTQNKHSFDYFHLDGTDERDLLTKQVFHFEREIEKVKKVERMHAMIRAEKEDRELKKIKQEEKLIKINQSVKIDVKRPQNRMPKPEVKKETNKSIENFT